MESYGDIRRRGWLGGAAYVVVVGSLTASAFSDGEGFGWRLGVAMVLTLPALVGALPVIYLVGAFLWSATGAGDGGPMWPVTLGFTMLFASTALANVWLFRRACGWYKRRSEHPGVVTVPSSVKPH